MLKLHRYLNWADKKLHSASFYIESKDEISEDLLSDFKDDKGVTSKPGLIDVSKMKTDEQIKNASK